MAAAEGSVISSTIVFIFYFSKYDGDGFGERAAQFGRQDACAEE